jgi:hypothetical protein
MGGGIRLLDHVMCSAAAAEKARSAVTETALAEEAGSTGTETAAAEEAGIVGDLDQVLVSAFIFYLSRINWL